jgi:hypothetical protein
VHRRYTGIQTLRPQKRLKSCEHHKAEDPVPQSRPVVKPQDDEYHPVSLEFGFSAFS